MKSGLIAAALLALPGGALAFVANPALSGTARAADVTMTVGQVAIWDFDAPGTGTGRIDLPKGADFALEVDNNDETEDSGLVTLSDAGGRAIVSTPIQGGEDVSVGGTTFRTPYAGTYVVKVRLDNANFPGRAIIVVDKDCAASKATLCTLPVGVTRSNRLFNYGGIYPVDIHADIDWFRTSLSRGRRYDVRLDEQYPDPYGGWLRMRDRYGKILASVPVGGGTASKSAAILGFRAPADGTYFVEAVWSGEAQDRYVLTLTAR